MSPWGHKESDTTERLSLCYYVMILENLGFEKENYI